MHHSRRLRKERISIKNRFLRAHGKKNALGGDSSKSWLRQRQILFPILVIFVIFVLLFVIKGIYVADRMSSETTTIEESSSPAAGEMEYEEAKKIFGG